MKNKYVAFLFTFSKKKSDEDIPKSIPWVFKSFFP